MLATAWTALYAGCGLSGPSADQDLITAAHPAAASRVLPWRERGYCPVLSSTTESQSSFYTTLHCAEIRNGWKFMHAGTEARKIPKNVLGGYRPLCVLGNLQSGLGCPLALPEDSRYIGRWQAPSSSLLPSPRTSRPHHRTYYKVELAYMRAQRAHTKSR